MPSPDARSDAVDTEPVEPGESTERATGLSWPRVVVLVVACAFATGAGVYAWLQWTDTPRPNEVDIGFYDDMSAHHRQAIDMAVLYLARGTDPVLRLAAEEVLLLQAGELYRMQRDLAHWDETGTPDTAMEWMGMSGAQDQQPGMASEAEMKRLAEAEGAELDDLFSQLLIDHHAGGSHMARAAAADASIREVRELAAAMAETQQTEIDETNARRQKLGLPVHEPDVVFTSESGG
jgi:uncharacterized protein (DUF305 family)